jgi:hypothetical protein
LISLKVGVAIKMGATKADFDSCVAIRESLLDQCNGNAIERELIRDRGWIQIRLPPRSWSLCVNRRRVL